jgi:antibiotic biosynthesis monooxygenase (ABM) superfamily enzyme
VTLVVVLAVRAAAAGVFRDFERRAATIMRDHGGAIERTVVIPGAGADIFREVHIVTFPDDHAFEAYRSDPRLAAIAHLREQAVVSTEVLMGHDGPDYMSSRAGEQPSR